MNRNFILSFLTIVLLVYAGILLSAGSDDCQTTIREQVRANNPKVEKIVFHSDSETHQEKSNTETVLKGNGEFLRHTGKWAKFSWECNYNTAKNIVNSADYSVTTAESHPVAGSPIAVLRDFMGARAGQAEGQLTDRGYKFVKTRKEGNNSYSYWLEKRTGFCVAIRTEEGRYQSIVYTKALDCD